MELTQAEIEQINAKLITWELAKKKLAQGQSVAAFGNGFDFQLIAFSDGTAFYQQIHHGWGEPCLEEEVREFSEVNRETLVKAGLLRRENNRL